MGESGVTKYYDDCLEEGLQFQDYATKWFYDCGIPLVNYVSILRSQKSGENFAGIEIKKDKIFRKTGNLYIETEERINTDRGFVSSGIYREQAWLLAIGDEERIWILPLNLLRGLHRSGKYKEAGNQTSRGFLLPLPDANKYAARVLTKDLDT